MTSLSQMIDYKYIINGSRIWLKVLYDKTLSTMADIKQVGWCTIRVNDDAPNSKELTIRPTSHSEHNPESDTDENKPYSKVYLCDIEEDDVNLVNVEIKLNQATGKTVIKDKISPLSLLM